MPKAEIWKKIKDYEMYQVSNFGRIKRIFLIAPERILKQSRSSCDRPQVSLSKNNKRKTRVVHRLVLEAFRGAPPTDKHEAAHNDGNHLNNHLSNLRWATHKENMEDREKHGTVARGSRHGNARLTERKVSAILRSNERMVILAQKFSVGLSTIKRVRRGESWQHVPRNGCRVMDTLP